MTSTISATFLSLPWPPSINHYWMPIPGLRGMTLTKVGRRYRHDVESVVRMKFGPGAIEPYRAPVRVDVELRAPDRRRRDIDNSIKSLFDAITYAGIWSDDHLVDEMTVRRGQVYAGGRAIVMITALDPIPDRPSPSLHAEA